MPTMGEGHAGNASAALEAEPIRRWLRGFFVRRVPNGSDVDDLVQDVFVRIAGRDSGEPIENLGAYVLRTAVTVLADRGRRSLARRVDLHVPFEAELHGGEEISPERVLSGRQELNAATAALLSLPERTRAIFVLRRLEGLRHRDIAQHLGISVSAVEKHMVKAIRHLSNELEDRLGS
jgi:RNA polymerase sigma-70 factor (ECF subfamily)